MALALFMSGLVVGVAVSAVLAIIVIASIMYFLGLYKRLLAFKNRINRSFSDIDVLLKQRHDELPKLVVTCKGYMQQQRSALQAVTEARAAVVRATTPAAKAQADNTVNATLKTLFAAAEKYPDLRANSNFRQLQRRITELDTKIAVQSSAYNQDVNDFNFRIAQVPASLVARFMGLQPHALFQVTEAGREDVKAS